MGRHDGLRATGPIRLGVYVDSKEIGGAEAAVARLLAALGDEVSVQIVGTDVSVVHWLAQAAGAESETVIPVVRGKRDLIGMLRHCARVGRGVEVLHVNLWHPWAAHYALLAAWLRRVPVVVVVHADLEEHSRLSVVVSRWFFRRAASVVAVSRQMARTLEHRAGLEPGSVLTVYNGIDTVSMPTRTQAGGRLCALGRLSEEKGFDVLIHAMQWLPEASLVVVGDGPERERLEAQAKALGVGERVSFTGWLDDPEPIFAQCDILVAPSRRESFGMAVAEAMRAGMAVVATSVGGLPELVIEGETGLLVAPDDPMALAKAVTQLIEDPEAAGRFGQAGRERVMANFSADATRAQMLEIYRRAALRHG